MSSLYEVIVEDIEQKIKDGELKENDKMYSERSLATRFKVSRTVVREAMGVLREKGLIKTEPGRGAFITIPNFDSVAESIHSIMKYHNASIEDILEARTEMEIVIVKKALESVNKNNNESKMKRIKEIYRLMTDAESIEAYIKLDEEFHREIACISDNKIFEFLIDVFIEATQNVLFKITHFFPDSISSANEHHLSLIQAIDNSEEDRAINIIKEHMQIINEEIKELKKNKYI